MKRYKVNSPFLGKSPIIYFLYNNNKVVYIGESGCGLKRLDAHLGVKEFDSFSFIEASSDRFIRRSLESLLIDIYKPILNGKADYYKKSMFIYGYLHKDILFNMLETYLGAPSSKITYFLKNLNKYCTKGPINDFYLLSEVQSLIVKI